MRPSTLSLGFALLLVLSLGVKVQARLGSSSPAIASDGEDIIATLGRSGFATSRAAPNTDPTWVYGVKGECKLQIADISLQGWHRSALELEAVGRSILYSVGGRLHTEQPILWPMMIHYFRRLERYVGIDAPPPRARAIVIGPGCPAAPIPQLELEALS
jgi:hypothetical protein